MTAPATLRAFGIALVALTLASTRAPAYRFDGIRWPTATATFWVSIPGAGGLWNTAFETAMADWYDATGFDYRIFSGSYRDPCINQPDGVNGVKFAFQSCSGAFGENTLAITHTLYRGSTISNTGIVFNKGLSWNVYSGPLKSSPEEFRRVAVHELGHAIGLDHEDRFPAIMAPLASNLEHPTSDDRAGVWALYPEIAPAVQDDHADSPGNAATPIVPNGSSVAGRFERAGDADVFRFTATVGLTYTITTDALAGGADTVLELIASNGTTVLLQDDDGNGNLASRIDYTASTSGTLYVRVTPYADASAQGTYQVRITAISIPTPAGCGDGVLAGSEICDDGNVTPNDGCSAICEAEPTAAGFAAAGGYQAYLAEPGNADVLNAYLGSTSGPCDAAAALDHWLREGRSAGLAFARGKLRSDAAGGATDPDYAIDGGFSWDYQGYHGMTNTVVIITRDAPKPQGWDGRDPLLERCQSFNLGSAYRARDYATINTDVRDAIDGGLVPSFASVTDHYVKYGFKEGRLTNSGWTQPQLDAWNDAAYLAANPDVNTFFQGAQNEGWKAFGKIGFAHWINFGQYEGRNTGQ